MGEQVAAAYKFVIRIPDVARASRFGVSISPPKAPRAENPRSSATIRRIFGAPPSTEFSETLSTGADAITAAEQARAIIAKTALVIFFIGGCSSY